jgi:hypothetical protein
MRDPVDPNKLDAPSATLYRAAISLGAQETQLIWTRYSGFILMNGFFVSALTNEKVREHYAVLAILGCVVLILNCVWHVLNYAGWQNQNLLYRLAGGVFESDVGLLTDYFRTKNLTPIGWIYWLAQTIPTMFSLVAFACLGTSVEVVFGLSSFRAWLFSIVVWLLSAGLVLWIEYKAIASQAKHGIIEPA